jgi:uncharacterized OB-fold protein
MKSVRCGRCGLLNFAGSADCKRCHSSLDAGDSHHEAEAHGAAAPVK